ncbi:hypothetical protein [Mesorhizobium sp. M0959]|uniref:hypothetical protein n=1 Tax=Mesorhizobium sp. M0959 TaxID=2957034 RepID=UPI00333A4174
MLNRSSATVLRQIGAGIIPAEQYCEGAPWVIKRGDVEEFASDRVRQAVKAPVIRKFGAKGPTFNNVAT